MIHTESRNGWVITVWETALTVWQFIATIEHEFHNGTVSAIDKKQAVDEVVKKLANQKEG